LRCISDLLFYIMEVASLIANQISIADWDKFVNYFLTKVYTVFWS
jgi:hypothetical protein